MRALVTSGVRGDPVPELKMSAAMQKVICSRVSASSWSNWSELWEVGCGEPGKVEPGKAAGGEEGMARSLMSGVRRKL